MALKVAPSWSSIRPGCGRGALRPSSHAHSVLLPALAACGMNPVPGIALPQTAVGKAQTKTGHQRQDYSDVDGSGGGSDIRQAY